MDVDAGGAVHRPSAYRSTTARWLVSARSGCEQEGVALHDGDLTVGPMSTGGFRVAATFPLREVMV